MAMLVPMALVPAALRARTLPEPSGPRERAQGYLGVDFHDTSEEQISALHLQGPRGAEITLVDHDGPAGKAGLQPHDIVLQVNGQNIEGAEDLRRRIRESSPGTAVSLSIVRQGRALTLTAKLANRADVERQAWQHMTGPDPMTGDDAPVENIIVEHYTMETAPMPRSPSRGQSFIGTVLRSAPYTGATVETMSPQLAGFFGAPPKSGLLVHGVEPNSPAALAGLRAGDVVLTVNASPVASTSDWSKRLRAGSGRPVSLTILREKHEQTLTMQPDLKRHSLLEWPKLF
jgi:S1-C subfamily serine protease